MSTYRRDLEVHDVPPAAGVPTQAGSVFLPATVAIGVTTLEVGSGADLMPIVTFNGLGHGNVNLHFEGGPRAVERLRDRLTDYLLLTEAASAERAIVAEERQREAGASEDDDG